MEYKKAMALAFMVVVALSAIAVSVASADVFSSSGTFPIK
jgi:hypothetical protein